MKSSPSAKFGGVKSGTYSHVGRAPILSYLKRSLATAAMCSVASIAAYARSAELERGQSTTCQSLSDPSAPPYLPRAKKTYGDAIEVEIPRSGA